MTWNPIDPAPYESAWSVITKLMALNFFKPYDIVRAIKKTGSCSTRRLDFRDSTWINFERYGAMLEIDPERLRVGFLDQLGFPKFTYYDGPHGIRHCPECLKFGYHSVFFDLALVKDCPIHQKPLEKGCAICCATVSRNGLLRQATQYPAEDGVTYDGAWRADIYLSKCKHVYFNPEMVLEIERFSSDERGEVRIACESLIRWWKDVFSGPDAVTVLVASLAQRSFSDRERSDLRLSLDLACRLAGNFPWTTTISPSPASCLVFYSKRGTEDEVEGRIDLDSDLGRIFRSVRRHIFNKYVRRLHLSCWREMKDYDIQMSRAISRQSVCTMTLAYMSWRMSIEGYSNIEVFGLKRSHKPSILQGNIRTRTASESANFWYVQFFAILGKINEMIREGGHFYIERSDGPHFISCYSAVMLGEEQGSSGNTWGVAYPNKELCIQNAAKRCCGIKRERLEMLSARCLNSVRSWSWTWGHSSYDKPRLLFRVKDDENYSQHYDYLDL